MNKLFALALVLLFSAAALSYADSYVPGHYRSDGTWVEGHYRSNSNSTNHDNYSTQYNYNPYTSETGHRARDYSPEAYNYGSGKTIYTGSKGGQYYINDNGKKTYVPKR